MVKAGQKFSERTWTLADYSSSLVKYSEFKEGTTVMSAYRDLSCQTKMALFRRTTRVCKKDLKLV